MRVRRLISLLPFAEEERDTITLGANIRLDSARHRLAMIDPEFVETVAGENTAATRVLSVSSLVRWVGFEADEDHVVDEAGDTVSSLRFRLTDGTTTLWWNGAAWAAPANATQWNTEDEIAANISTFPVTTTRRLGVLINFVSLDPRATSYLREIRLAWESTIEFAEDVILRSLLPRLRDAVRPIGRLDYTMPASGSTITLAAMRALLETGYNIVDIDSVFNTTTDPAMLVNIMATYAAGVLTLTGAPAANDVLRINFIYQPEVAETTSQDIEEVAHLPALIVRDVREAAPLAGASGTWTCTRKATGASVVLPPPLHVTFSGMLEVRADKLVDRRRIEDQVLATFRREPTLRSTGLDRRYSLVLTSEFETVGSPGQDEIHMSQAGFQIMNTLFWNQDAYDDRLPARLVLNTSVRASADPANVGLGAARVIVNRE